MRSVLVILAFLALTPTACLLLTPPAWAVNPDEMLANPTLEARAREISKGLRCLVCQNESIDDSNADLARDLRLLVRDRLQKGESDAQVVAYIVSRYGDYVLLKPPFTLSTAVLWLAPPGLLLMAGFAVWQFYRRRPEAETRALSDEERDRINRLLSEKESS